jgi:hypothetical protein
MCFCIITLEKNINNFLKKVKVISISNIIENEYGYYVLISYEN